MKKKKIIKLHWCQWRYNGDGISHSIQIHIQYTIQAHIQVGPYKPKILQPFLVVRKKEMT